MSYSALLSSDEPITCTICGEEFKDGDRVIALLYTYYREMPGFEEGDYTLDFDWDDDGVAHVTCFNPKKS